MKTIVKFLFAVTTVALAAQASAQVTFHEHDDFQGRAFSTRQQVSDFGRSGLDDRVSSVVVVGQRWQACDAKRFDGRCVVLRPGRYPSLAAIGLDNRISSVRPLHANARVAEADYAPMPVVAQDFRRRRNERLFEAEVSSARAVLGTPGQRCWIERERVAQQAPQAGLNIGGAAVGAIIGGILGHQVGGGSGQKIATVAGALGGGALGSQYGRNDAPEAAMQDVRRCDDNPAQATPGYWDVTYDFRGEHHRVQMATDPGRTVTVNRKGEPRS